MAWACARLRHRPGIRWLASYVEEGGRRLPRLAPALVADLLWALAAWGHVPPPEWMAALEEEVLRRR